MAFGSSLPGSDPNPATSSDGVTDPPDGGDEASSKKVAPLRRNRTATRGVVTGTSAVADEGDGEAVASSSLSLAPWANPSGSIIEDTAISKFSNACIASNAARHSAATRAARRQRENGEQLNHNDYGYTTDDDE